MGSVGAAELPRPFYDQWSGRRRSAAHAVWRWHSALAAAARTPPDEYADASASFWEEEQSRAEAGDPLRVLPDEVCRDAYAACEAFGLDRSWLAAQVGATREQLGRPVRFATETALKQFVGRWAVPHGRLLAGLAGITLAGRLAFVDELARGFFYLARLVRLPADLEQDRLFLSQEALRRKDVSVEQLRAGPPDEAVQALLWKESVRIRDALAQGRPMIGHLSLRHRFALKRFWVGALALLDELDRRNYDLWSRPLTLSPWRRIQVYLQTLLGRSVSR
jgi:phytoene synthase